jgi:hypothetical protein
MDEALPKAGASPLHIDNSPIHISGTALYIKNLNAYMEQPLLDGLS